MNNSVLNSIRFIVFLSLQVLIFNNINLFGYLNPYPYVLFILLYPVNSNKSVLLLGSFALGILLDMFCNSGGIHTTASLILAFIRPTLFKFSFGLSYEYQTVKIADKISPERITLLLLAIFIHHFILFYLEYFRIGLLFTILSRTLLSTLFTFTICLLIIYLIKPNKR
ncbi:MAG: rod shape-determining protein MreD [Flavobacterium sp.]|uniref:Rod shape-determining protein MreD n=1 Tax=Flavobacterium celericrescens TaxID=2709780 RepID=A0ABX0IFE7_9FLAO|nr:rod shape-determining protein MreD [Flavobacterium celericrescens]NHM04955.1 rod shape-determining protein MreD [Flavobacterium celericrescens]